MPTSLLACALLLAPPAPPAAPPSWATAALERNSADLFDSYPPTRCAAKQLMGKEYQVLLDGEADGGSAGADVEVLGAADKAGGTVSFRALWQTLTVRLLWVHPDGGVIVGLAVEDQPLRLVTNRAALKAAPPAVIAAFVSYVGTLESRGGDTPWANATPQWDVRQGDLAACRGEQANEEAARYEEVLAGTRCDASVADWGTFGGEPALVVPAEGQARVPLAAAPRAPADGESAPYLVAGDLVQLLLTRDRTFAQREGFVCAYYRAKGGAVSVGWVPEARTAALPAEPDALAVMIASLPAAKSWPAKTTAWLDFPGRHHDPRYAAYAALASKGKELALTLSSTYGGNEGGPPGDRAHPNCKSSLRLAGASLRVATGSNDEITAATVARFNNAVWVTAPGFCDNQAFSAIFYPTP